MATWFCKIDGKLYGPYDGAKLRQMAEDDRLLPEDSLREGEDGVWFPASEMDNLFPKRAASDRDDEDYDDDRRDRPKKWKKKGKSSNYYRVLWQNVHEGGQWKQILAITFGLQVLIPSVIMLFGTLILAAGVHGRGAGALAVLILIGVPIKVGLLALSFFIDVLIFGLPCLILRVRLNPRRDSVLDLFAYSYLIGLLPTLIRELVGLGSQRWAIILMLLYPFFHVAVLTYLMHNYWGFTPGRSFLLAGIRFGYTMLFMIALVLLWLSLGGIR